MFLGKKEKSSEFSLIKSFITDYAKKERFLQKPFLIEEHFSSTRVDQMKMSFIIKAYTIRPEFKSYLRL